MKSIEVELLAPAGNKEAFIGAINAGADAVYLGGEKYSARAYADNFSTEDIIFCIRYAHLRGKKVYLTVNTLMKDFEIEELCDYIAPMYEAGLDACIIQDIGAFALLKNAFPDMEMHVSTQMTITGIYGAKMLKDMGASRIVPARELSLEEIKYIRDETGLEMETFIHGAMCYSYSGQCLFSSILGGRSGNRGRCAQPCRLPYKVSVKGQTTGECYPLSLKDMCTIEHIESLMEAGIDSFKIEGRMKKPEYSAGVTAIYRKYIDLKKKNPTKPLHFEKKDLEQLNHLYIRSERQDGYYFKQNGADMVTLNSPSYSGSDDTLLQEIKGKYLSDNYRFPPTVYANVVRGEKISLTYLCNNISVTVEGEIVQAAQKAALTEESIAKQLTKLGDTSFEAQEINIYTDNQSFCSIKSLNELRREAISLLEDALIESYGLKAHRNYQPLNIAVKEDTATIKKTFKQGYSLHFSNKEQLIAFCEYAKKSSDLNISHIYVESEVLLQVDKITEKICDYPIYVALPYVMRKKDASLIRELVNKCMALDIKGFVIRNLEEYAFLQEIGYNGEIRSDAGIYIWNQYSMNFWSKRLSGIHCPLELNKKEWKHLFYNIPMEKLVYGRIPMMITANCVAKTTTHCLNHQKENTIAYITDRYQKQFPVVLSCKYCTNIIYNSVPLSLHKDLAEYNDYIVKKLQFTTENAAETIEIIKFFLKNPTEELTEPPFKEYTTAHEKRGVL